MIDVVPNAGVIALGKQREGLITRVVLPNIRQGAGAIQLSHQRSDDKEPYPVPIREDGDKVYWTVTRLDTTYPGRGQAELQWLGEDGEVAKSAIYQTFTIRSMPEPGAVPDEPLKPYIQAVAKNAQAAKDSAEAAKKAAQEAQEAAETAVLYTEQNLTDSQQERARYNINAADKARQNILVGTETGNPISVDDAFAAPLCGLTVYGKSTQGNTTGAQLFDVSNADVVQMYIANSGIGNYVENYSVIIPIKPSTSYTISEKNNKLFRVAITEEYPIESALTLFKDVATVYKNITTPNNLQNGNFLMIQLYGNFAHAPDFSGLMLNEGSTTKPWEPYTGGEPSPSPDYPQEIKSAGDIGSVAVTLSDGNGKTQTLTLPTPNGLLGIPVTSGGNYIDPSGQQWVCDEVDLEQGVKVQRVDKAAFDATKMLAEQNAILAAPIETPLPPAEIAAYKALTAYAPDTVVQASDGAGVKLEYQRDVNIAIKKLEDAVASMTAT